MLILTRKRNESIFITDRETGDKIKVLVASGTGRIALGIEAAAKYRIQRAEHAHQPAPAAATTEATD